MRFDGKTIVTGFKPFANYRVNSSWEAVKVLKEKRREIYCQELNVDHLAVHNEINGLFFEKILPISCF